MRLSSSRAPPPRNIIRSTSRLRLRGGYGSQPYGNGYGYNGGYNNYGQVRALQARIDALQNRIRYMRRGGNRRRRGLREEARNIEQRLRQASRNGLNPYEANDIQQRIARLEQRVNYANGKPLRPQRLRQRLQRLQQRPGLLR